MNIIIITILLTVFGVCLVAYLTWLGISSYKLMKFKTKTDNAIKHIERWIDDNNNTINNNLDKSIEQLSINACNKYNEIDKNIEDLSISLNSKIDSRYDKLYNLLNESNKTQ